MPRDVPSRSETGASPWRDGREGASVALPLLEKAVLSRPDDLTAWESKGDALGLLGRPEEGLRAYLVALSKDPSRETAIAGAANLASRAGRRQEAADLWRRAIAVNPWRADYHAELGRVLMQSGDWRSATAAFREALRLNPTPIEFRKWLVQCDLRLGDLESAGRDFETLIGFDPPDRDALQRWFQSQLQRPLGRRGPGNAPTRHWHLRRRAPAPTGHQCCPVGAGGSMLEPSD